MPCDFANRGLEAHERQVEEFKRPCDALQKHLFRIFNRLKVRPRYTANFSHRRKAVIEFRCVAVRLPRIAPGPVNAEPALARYVLSRRMKLVVGSTPTSALAHKSSPVSIRHVLLFPQRRGGAGHRMRRICRHNCRWECSSTYWQWCSSSRRSE